MATSTWLASLLTPLTVRTVMVSACCQTGSPASPSRDGTLKSDGIRLAIRVVGMLFIT